MKIESREKLKDITKRLADLSSDLLELERNQEDTLDNLPQKMQDSEKGKRMKEVIEDLDAAVISVQDAIQFIEGVLNRKKRFFDDYLPT